METEYVDFVRLMNEEGVEQMIFDECYQNRLVLTVHGVSINFINLRELIKNKRAVGRSQDLRDLDNLPASS